MAHTAELSGKYVRERSRRVQKSLNENQCQAGVSIYASIFFTYREVVPSEVLKLENMVLDPVLKLLVFPLQEL